MQPKVKSNRPPVKILAAIRNVRGLERPTTDMNRKQRRLWWKNNRKKLNLPAWGEKSI